METNNEKNEKKTMKEKKKERRKGERNMIEEGSVMFIDPSRYYPSSPSRFPSLI